jgi:hypothetical protein
MKPWVPSPALQEEKKKKLEGLPDVSWNGLIGFSAVISKEEAEV